MNTFIIAIYAILFAVICALGITWMVLYLLRDHPVDRDEDCAEAEVRVRNSMRGKL